jgi:hypothetical protein
MPGFIDDTKRLSFVPTSDRVSDHAPAKSPLQIMKRLVEAFYDSKRLTAFHMLDRQRYRSIHDLYHASSTEARRSKMTGQ